jgi:ornithine cyclodeaminase/alanine dehydrogenase-like protein (mu-crystallin family)
MRVCVTGAGVQGEFELRALTRMRAVTDVRTYDTPPGGRSRTQSPAWHVHTKAVDRGAGCLIDFLE